MRKVIKSSRRLIKADMGDQIIDLLGLLYDVTDKYNTSHPVSGDWDTEANHEMLTIADAFNISTESAKALMINELGFSERDFRMYNNLNGSINIKGSEKTMNEYIQPMIDDIAYQVYDNYNGEPGYTYEDYAQAIIKHLEDDYEWTLDEEFTMEDIYKAMDDYTWTY